MQVKMSEYLTAVKPDMQKLVELLKKDFAYVSVLCTDVTGTTYLVGQRQTSVGDYHFNERGFVVRVYENSCYMEYSFNEYEDIEKLASTITETLKKELHMMEELGIEKMEAPLIHEEKIGEIHDWRDRCGSDERFSRGDSGPTEKDQRYGSSRKICY